jgi:protein-S-isoprenylcysteine O-methyltransferase Ste14
MYVAVVSLILGQAMVFGNMQMLVYGLCVWLAMHLFVLVYEEPTLRRTFAEEYSDFCAHVPRWIPRLTPWQ